ncbi:MAG: hypothetical protein ABIK19_04045 [candidate division WOR-3 bacterium]
MNFLIVYYSRTGNTKILAELLAADLKKLLSDKNSTVAIEEIKDLKKRTGFWNWLIAGRDALKKKLTVINSPKYQIVNFDMILLGTPIWAGTLSPAIRTYIVQYRDQLKKVAFFTTSKFQNLQVFEELKELCRLTPVCYLNITNAELKSLTSAPNKLTESVQKKIRDFTEKLMLWNR